MTAILLAMQGAVSQGILWGVMTLGVYITFKVLDFADMTVDGSFALGGILSASLISIYGLDPYLTLIFSAIAGALAGLVTGFLNTKFKIHGILAGILTQLALYSINIRIAGRANVPLLGMDTIIKEINKFGFSTTSSTLIVGISVSVVLILILYWFFGTEIGCSIRATGNNQKMVRALGVNTDTMIIVGLMLSNALVGLSGALVAQSQGYADVGMGTGTIVIGLASVIIGEVVFGKHFGFWYTLLSVILGSIIYRIVIASVLQLGMKANDLKLFTAIIVAIALAVPVLKKYFSKMNSNFVNRFFKKKAKEETEKNS